MPRCSNGQAPSPQRPVAEVAVSLPQSGPDTAAPANPNVDRLQTAPTLLQKEQGNG